MEVVFFISTIASGIIYDILKKMVNDAYKNVKSKLKKELRETLKDSFPNEPFSDEQYEQIAIILENTNEINLKTKGTFFDYLENNKPRFAKILEEKESIGTIKKVDQKTEGDYSPNIYGNKNKIIYGSDIEKK